MKAVKTHFETIPTEVVKTLIKESAEMNAIKSDGERSDTQTDIQRTEAQLDVNSPRENWREVAQRIQHEPDPGRMNDLVRQLLGILEKETSAGAKTRDAEDPRGGE